MNDRAVTPNYGERIMEDSDVSDIRELLTNREIDRLIEIMREAPYYTMSALPTWKELHQLRNHIIERLNEESVEP